MRHVNLIENALGELKYHYPADNTAAIITVASLDDEETFHVVEWIAWSYDAIPTGRLTVAYAGTTILDLDITSSGPGFIPFDTTKLHNNATPDEELVITLAAGGIGIAGKLSARVS